MAHPTDQQLIDLVYVSDDVNDLDTRVSLQFGAEHIAAARLSAVRVTAQVRAGKIRAYAVTANTRQAAAPEIPTVDEARLPGFHTAVWHGIWLPKGTPKDIIMKLNAAIVETLADSAVRERFADLGQEIPVREQQTPEALFAHHKAEIDKWWPIIRAAGLKAE